MIVRFSVENFLSYGDKQTFSMIAGQTRNHKDHLISAGSVQLLKLSAVYGANASGKSKLFEAMRFATHVIKSKIPANAVNMFCRQAEKNELAPSTFEFEFYTNDTFYAYGFSAILSLQQITAEWLYQLKPKENDQEFIYERTFQEETYRLEQNRKLLKLSDEEYKFLDVSNEFMDDRRVLFLNTINKSEKAVRSPSMRHLIDTFSFFATEMEFINPDTAIRDFGKYETNADEFEKFKELVSGFDTGIVDIKKERMDLKELEKRLPHSAYKTLISNIEENRNSPFLKAFEIVHVGSAGWYKIEQKRNTQELEVTTILLKHKNSNYDFSFSEESDGTQKIFDLLRIVQQNKVGRVYVVDELERSLHPKVTERLIKLFIELTAGLKTQLIFTTHESSIMTQDIFRRDEIWFVEKNKKNTSELYSLDRFSERYDRRIDKAYLEGRYGALPIFVQIEESDGES